MLTDLRYAIRALRAAPGFTLIAAGTLALAIAVNTIAFTLLNSLVLRPMPVRDASRVVRIYPVDADGRRRNLFSYPDVESYRAQLQSFEALVPYIPTQVTVGPDDVSVEPQAGLAYAVSATHFPALGIEPSLGRSFTATEEVGTASDPVAVISHSLWERRFAAAPDVVGNRVVVNGRPFSIVGVGPRSFVGTEPLSPDVWVPLSALASLEGGGALNDRNNAGLLLLGRLRAGVARASAEQEVSIVTARLAAAYPAPDRATRAEIAPGTFFPLDRELAPIVTLVMSTIGLVLIIACANVANLSLARAARMRRQIAVRLALGAARWQIVRYHMLESVLVALLSGAAGLLLSAWALRLLHPLGLSLLPESWAGVVLDVSPDVRVFLYTLLLSLVAAMLFGLGPAVQASSPHVAGALREDPTVLGARISRSSMRDGLVVVQIAVCLMLLAVAALTARSLQRTRTLDIGFTSSGVVYTHADLRRYGYSPAAAAELYHRLEARARSVPGVRTVAWTTHVPLTGGVVRVALRPDGHAADTVTSYTAVSPSYFEALGIRLVEGRTFSAEEASSGAPVAVISEALARRFWPDPVGGGSHSSALGKRLTSPRSPSPLTVIGIARDAADVAIWREKELSVYVPAVIDGVAALQMLVGTAGSTDLVVSQLRHAARESGRHLHMEIRPLDDVLRFWAMPARVAAITAAILGGLALLLAAVGIYGMLAQAVTQRTREIGIRMALGARAQDVVTLMVGAGARLVGIGIAAGLIGAFTTTRFLTVLLAGVDPLDPWAFAAATAFLAVIGLAACYLPVRRAAHLDPIVALRSDK